MLYLFSDMCKTMQSMKLYTKPIELTYVIMSRYANTYTILNK